MNIEILLTEAEIASEFQEALEARDLPEKFFYWLPLSVKYWRSLAAEPGYQELINAWTAVSGRASDLTAHFGAEVPVVSFGAGDGTKDRPFLRAIQSTGKTAKYFPVDASQTLLESACAGAEDDDIETIGIKADISSRMHVLLAADAAEAPRIFLMAGHTLSGFDPIDLLTNVSEAMRPGDRLVIDGELHTPSAIELLESPRSRDFAFAPLGSLGMVAEDGRIRFEQKLDSRHAGLIMITKHFLADRDLRASLGGDDIVLARGERIFMNFHYLYEPEAFLWLLEKHGKLKVEEQLFSIDGRFITAICSK